MAASKLQIPPSEVQFHSSIPPSKVQVLSEPAEHGTIWNSHASRYGPAYVAHLVERISEANRATFRRYLTAKEAQGLKTASLTGCAYNLFKLDKLTNGKSWDELEKNTHELTEAMVRFARDHSPITVSTWAAQVKAFYAWKNGGICPPQVRIALKRRNVGRESHRQPIPGDVFERLVVAARETFDPVRAAFQEAFLWTLLDSGFRISELLSLRWGNVTFRDGGVELALSADAPDLKTGPRTIFVVRCAPALLRWRERCPNVRPDAPVWPAHRAPDRPMLRTSVDNFLARIAIRAGVKPPHPHLFRHTRATEAARAGWNVHQMNRFFGWSGNSSMAATYVHLALSDVEERVKADVAPVTSAPAILAPVNPAPVAIPAPEPAPVVAPVPAPEAATASPAPASPGFDPATFGAAFAAAFSAMGPPKKPTTGASQ